MESASNPFASVPSKMQALEAGTKIVEFGWKHNEDAEKLLKSFFSHLGIDWDRLIMHGLPNPRLLRQELDKLSIQDPNIKEWLWAGYEVQIAKYTQNNDRFNYLPATTAILYSAGVSNKYIEQINSTSLDELLSKLAKIAKNEDLKPQ